MSGKAKVSERPDTHDMVMVHRALRREFRFMAPLVRAVDPGDRHRATVVAAHATEMTTVLYHHHVNEDALVWPRLRARAEAADELITRMEVQHHQITDGLDGMALLLPVWAAAPNTVTGDELAVAADQLSAALDAHLDEEEQAVLPLVTVHLTDKEWAELGKRGMASLPKRRIFVFIAHILEDANTAESRSFLAKIPPLARVAYRLLGPRTHRRETAILRRPLG